VGQIGVAINGGGYVFCNTHNILAEIEAKKIVAMYRAANE